MRGEPPRRARKFCEEQTDAHDLGRAQVFGHAAEGNVCGDERDGEARSGQEHGEVFHAAARGEKFGLAGKLESDFVHAGLVNRPGHDRIDLPGEGKLGGFFQGGLGGARAVGSGLA